MVAFCILALALPGGGAVFTTNATVSETNTTYEGQDIVIDGPGVTVAIDGPHSFNSFLLTNGAVLTHSACTATNTHKLDLTVANGVVVSADSKIDVSGMGYLAGRTASNTTVGAATGASGGSYGGLGGILVGTPNAVYGDYANPADWGSGSGPGAGGGGASGGGLVRLQAGQLGLDGQVLADGQARVSTGAGAGGGIYVTVQTLHGSGSIRAAGGGRVGWTFGAGAGGRVAVYAQDLSGFSSNRITAPGGFSGNVTGGAGTVYVRNPNEAYGTLIIDGGSGGTGWTPLGLAGTNSFTIPDMVLIRGTNTQVKPEHGGMSLGAGGLRMEGGARAEVESLLVAGDWVMDGSTLVGTNLQAANLLLTNTSVLTTYNGRTNQMYALDLTVANGLLVSVDSQIDVSGKGYLGGRTSENTTNGASTGVSGGSYGGLGGNLSGVANRVYGDYAWPADWGSGSGTANGSSAGGGLVWVTAGELVLDGQLLADGQIVNSAGGGSGGGIYVNVQVLQGAGIIRAAGGGGPMPAYGAGGGGRVAIYAQDLTGFDRNRITAPGGLKGNVAGGVGTVYVKTAGPAPGILVIDAGNGGDGWTPLGLAGTNWFTISDVVLIRGTNTHVTSEHSGLVLDFANTLVVTNGATLQANDLNLGPGSTLRFWNNSVITLGGSITSAVPVEISGASLLVDQIVAPALTLTGGAVLGCVASTTNQMHSLDLEVAGTVAVDASSRIDVSGLGYLGGRTIGNTTNGASTGVSGGSYGGLGGNLSGVANRVYGDYAWPADWGSGSGTANGSSAGGGLVWVTAGKLVLDGQLLADGQIVNSAGGGSGGGIYVNVQVLQGAGSIRAAGGGGPMPAYGAGGGGRVAIYAQDLSGFDRNRITAPGGVKGNVAGGAGTVYVETTGPASGTLVIDAGNGGDGWTPLGVAGTNSFTILGSVLIRGSNTFVQAEHAGLTVECVGGLRIAGGARSELGRLLVGGDLVVDGSTLLGTSIQAAGVVLTNGSLLSTYSSTATQIYALELLVTNQLAVSTNSMIDVSGKGYLAGWTAGNTTNGAAAGSSGGSYGGLGGNYIGGADNDVANAVYGSAADPEEWGSGSGPRNGGSSGGGLVRLQAGQLVLDGQLLADGQARDNVGAGSGGGILVAAQTLQGSGVIRAAGGGRPVYTLGGGGGGRVAVYASDWGGFNINNISVPGGRGAASGGAGTLHITHDRFPTLVRATYPIAGSSVGRLDGVTVRFTRTISTSPSNLGNILIEGPSGIVNPTSISAPDYDLLSIAFPTQTENGIYHVTLLPTMLDVEGFQLDQNANGIPGEPNDGYSVELIVDSVPPRITHHEPGGDVAGAATAVDIWFSEQIDATTLTPASLSILNPTNGTVAATAVQAVGFNRWRISFPPQTAAGNYRVLVSTNVTDLAGNALDTQNSEPVGFNLVPVDLQPGDSGDLVISTNQLWVGDLVTAAWTGRNATGSPLLGDWTDAVYLSADDHWDIGDLLLATVHHAGGLASNEVYAASATFAVPGVSPGSYRILVRTDSQNQETELNRTNNAVASAPLPLAYRSLVVNGPPLSGSLTPAYPFQYYVLQLADGQILRLHLQGQSGVNYLFVSQASIPTSANNDFSGTALASGQTIVLTGAPSGATYYVLVAGEQLGGPNTFELSAENGPFFVEAITPNQLVGGTSDRWWVDPMMFGQPAASISGVGFDQQTTVVFVEPGGQAREPDRLEFLDPTLLRVYVEAGLWATGVYSVRVTKGANTVVLTNAFTVVPGGEANFEASVVLPGAVDAAGGQTLYVEYANNGSRPMPAPLLKVTAVTNAIITTTHLNPGVFGPIRSVAGGGGGGGGGGSGQTLNQIPSYMFIVGVPIHSVQIMALGSGATPGWLQPGERGRVPVYFDGLTELLAEYRHTQTQFEVSSVTADDTTLVEFPSPAAGVSGNVMFPRNGRRFASSSPVMTNGTERLFTVPWAKLEGDSQPETADPGGWQALWQNLVANVGPLWVDYVMAMGDNMNYLAKIGQTTNDLGQLFNFEVLQASAALNPVRSLASAVDASAPGSGFPLVFRRVYGQPILSRYKLGPLGRGWTHNWDISVQVLTKTLGAVFHGPDGVDRTFYLLFSYDPNNAMYLEQGSNALLESIFGVFTLTENDKTTWRFRPDRRLDYVQDPNGNRITCGYTGSQLTSLAHSSGRQLILDYNADGRLWHLTDAVERVTTYEYQGEHLWRVTAPGNRVTILSYDLGSSPQSLHALTNVIHPDFTVDSFAFDRQGRLKQTSRSCCGAQRVTYDYDSAGTVTTTDATGRRTQLLYGLGGQLAQVRDGEGRIVNFGYGDNAQLSQLVGPGGERYRYTYGALNDLTAVEDPLRHTNTFAFETNFNRLAQVTDARSNGLHYDYDTRGNLSAITYADDTRELFAYDGQGNVMTSTNRRGGVINYRYNAAGQLTNKYYLTTTGRVDYAYAYDLAGNLTNATYWNPQFATQESVNMGYEPLTDRLRRIEYPGNKWFEFEYSASRRRTKRTDQDGNVVGYVYDTAGRLNYMTNGLGELIVRYDYDEAGWLQRKTLGNGVFTTNAYNNAGQILALNNRRADGALLSSYEYGYDASGRRTSMTTLAGRESYGYDPLGQLTRVTYPDGRVVTYAYDAAGNRTQVSDNGDGTPYAANPLNQYTTVGRESLFYDLDGNLTNNVSSLDPLLSTNYTFDIENRLVGVTTPTDTWVYSYDAFGNRIATTHNGQTTRYVIDPTGLGNVAAEYDDSGSLIVRYEHGLGLLARTDAANNSAFYTFSAIGHTSELTDPTGAVANSYSYDPFGLSVAKTELVPNPFEFVGELGAMRENNGLHFMRARFYDGMLGRFVTPDPVGILGRDGNLYRSFCNNPNELVDPSGLAGTGGISVGPVTASYGWGNGRHCVGLGTGFGTSGLVFSNVGQPNWGVDLALKTGWGFGLSYQNGDPESGPSVSLFGARGSGLSAGTSWGQNTLGIALGMGASISASWTVCLEDLTPQEVALMFMLAAPFPYPLYIYNWYLTQLLVNGDPNDKYAPVGYGVGAFVRAQDVLTYQVDFENEATATEPTHRVIVTDVLDPNVDLSTFELVEIAFANQSISIPAGLNHYEAVLPFNAGTNQILVEVTASLDVPSRTLTLALTSIDPATGWWPEDPLQGLLYPEDGTGRGKGSISYLVRPNPGLPTGTRIENRAQIVFDFNDPIDTPLVFNTLDSGAPTSTVAPLSTHVGRTFLVNWAGLDDAGGSGLASYDVYYSTDGTNYTLWLQDTLDTSDYFVGELGKTYTFYTLARDWVGNEQSAPMATVQTTVSANSPFLAPVAAQTLYPNDRLNVTNQVQGGTTGSFLFWLAPGAPAGADINPTNGVFHWTPTCAQASRTNWITLWVADASNTNLMDAVTFSVGVRECVVPGLGRIVLQAGDAGRLPINLISTVPLTNLAMTVQAPTNRLTGLSLEPVVPEICTNSIVFIGTNAGSGDPAYSGAGDQYLLTLTTCSNLFLIGTQQVAWLDFSTIAAQSSAIVTLRLDNGVGVEPDATEVRNFAPQAGRIVVIGPEPLLEAVMDTNRQPQLILYGRVGTNIVVEVNPDLGQTNDWRTACQVTMTNLFQTFTCEGLTNRTMFYRARRE